MQNPRGEKVLRKIMQWFQVAKAKAEISSLRLQNERLKKESEYEKFLDEQLKEKAQEYSRIQRETEKILKLTEAQRRIKALTENQKQLTKDVLEDEDFDDEEEEEEEEGDFVDGILKQVSQGLIQKYMPQPAAAIINSTSQPSDTKEKAKEIIEKLSPEQIETGMKLLEKYGIKL